MLTKSNIKTNKMSDLISKGYKKFPHQGYGKMFDIRSSGSIVNNRVLFSRDRLSYACAIGIAALSFVDKDIIDSLHNGTNGKLLDHVDVSKLDVIVHKKARIECNKRCKDVFSLVSDFAMHLNDDHRYSIPVIINLLRRKGL